jgi:protein-disulfide isomerase
MAKAKRRTSARRVPPSNARHRGGSSRRQRQTTQMALVAFLALAAVVGLIVAGSMLRGGEEPIARMGMQGDRTLGSPSAPVVLTVWEDYQCPFCKRANNEALAQVQRDYVDTGKVQVVFKNYAFIGEESIWAAEAAECAAEQGAFWPYHDKLMENQGPRNSGGFSKPNLVRLAGELGLRTDEFTTCLDSDRHAATVMAETEEGRQRGVRSLPTLFVNGRKVDNQTASLESIRKMVEQAAAGTGG